MTYSVTLIFAVLLLGSSSAFPRDWNAETDKEHQRMKDAPWILEFERQLYDLIFNTDPDNQNKRVVSLCPWLEWPQRYEKERFEWKQHRIAFEEAKVKVMGDLQTRGFHVFTIDMEVHLDGTVVPEHYWIITRQHVLAEQKSTWPPAAELHPLPNVKAASKIIQ